MRYIADKQCMKAYSQEGHLWHMNIIQKCMENEVYTNMQLIQCYTLRTIKEIYSNIQ